MAGFLLAEAYAEVGWRDKDFASGLKAAEGAFNRFVARIAAAGPAQAAAFGQAGQALGVYGDRMRSVAAQADSLANSLRGVTRAAVAMNAAMRGGSAAAMVSVIHAQGQAAAALARALDNASTASAQDVLKITAKISPMAKLLGMSPQKSMALAATARETGTNPDELSIS